MTVGGRANLLSCALQTTFKSFFPAVFASCRHFNTPSKNYDLEYLQSMEHEKLVYRVMRLQRLIDYYEQICSPLRINGKDKVRIDHPNPEDIITERTSMRKIALKVLYLGWDYAAYAWEDRMRGSKFEGSTNAVERVLLEAMLRQQLIPNFGTARGMSLDRCGRTDQLVSGMSQVVTARVRSNLDKGYGIWSVKDENEQIFDENSGNETEMKTKTTYHEEGFSNSDTTLDDGEIQYVTLLNAALPTDIRVMAWAPVAKAFSARYACKYRTYRYVFPRANLDVDLMNNLAQKFVGEHDFRNFCKRSDENLFKHMIREIISFKIAPLPHSPGKDVDVCAAIIRGKSFLHKQIRNMMGVLVYIGMGKASPSIIDDLLDIDKTPRKPQYDVARATNLTLIDCGYDSDDISWRWDDTALASTAQILASKYTEYSAKSEVLRHMYSEVHSKILDEENAQLSRHGFIETILNTDPIGCALFDLGSSKTIPEKQIVSKTRQVNRLIRKGKYRSAVRLQEEHVQEILDEEKASS